ncbi:hypothetical protein BCR35DRAFT_351515 [Leucosporidium creatinivorum]|uniref:DUF6593 domain-containing protein n=1 Tax=Leucosporidium creatinivorum TaxID=106004 RepID=A0A1Y2FPP5_9BASI|nr:hypothetical protein BCR35DRAFT_351515 [Leucosporidium creatinivorum]
MDSTQQTPAYDSEAPPYSPNQAPSSPSYGQPAYPQDRKERPATTLQDPAAPIVSTSATPPDLKAEDKETVLYYLKFGRKLGREWIASLHRGGKEGPFICSLDKKAWSHAKTINMPESDGGQRYSLIKPKVLSHAHYFDVPDGSRFEWRKDGVVTKNWTLRKQLPGQEPHDRQVVAEYKYSSFSSKKNGKLFVHADFLQQKVLDLIVATALAIEEWQREQD